LTAMNDNILTCAKDNEADYIRQLVAMGCPPTFANRAGQSALHIGGLWGSVEAVRVLLELKANPNAQNQLRGSTPLHATAMGKGSPERRAECIKAMLEAKADPRKIDFAGETALDCASDEVCRLALGAAPLILHKAVRTRKVDAVKGAATQIMRGQVDLSLESQSPDGDTALHLAVRMGWAEGVDLLLAVKCNPRQQNYEARAPVHTAVLQGNQRILQKLLQAKANVDVQDRDQDHDPRFSSVTHEETPDKHRTALHYAAQLGAVSSLRLLLQARANVNAADSKRVTPLHLSLGLRTDEGAELEEGCGIKVVGLEKRADLNGQLGAVIGPEGHTDDGKPSRWPVLLDSDQGDGMLLKEANLQRLPEETLDILLEARADVNQGNQSMGETRTVLHEAVRLRDAELTRKVLAAGAQVQQQDAKVGMSALHLAARAKSYDLVSILVEARADLSQVNSNGKTAAELAETNRAPAAILALLRGEEAAAPAAGAGEEEKDERQQRVEDLTPEQRAMLFLD